MFRKLHSEIKLSSDASFQDELENGKFKSKVYCWFHHVEQNTQPRDSLIVNNDHSRVSHIGTNHAACLGFFGQIPREVSTRFTNLYLFERCCYMQEPRKQPELELTKKGNKSSTIE